MSRIIVDNAAQQDTDAITTTSTKDSDPGNAVVTKDWIDRLVAPGGILDLSVMKSDIANAKAKISQLENSLALATTKLNSMVNQLDSVVRVANDNKAAIQANNENLIRRISALESKITREFLTKVEAANTYVTLAQMPYRLKLFIYDAKNMTPVYNPHNMRVLRGSANYIRIWTMEKEHPAGLVWNHSKESQCSVFWDNGYGDYPDMPGSGPWEGIAFFQGGTSMPVGELPHWMTFLCICRRDA